MNRFPVSGPDKQASITARSDRGRSDTRTSGISDRHAKAVGGFRIVSEINLRRSLCQLSPGGPGSSPYLQKVAGSSYVAEARNELSRSPAASRSAQLTLWSRDRRPSKEVDMGTLLTSWTRAPLPLSPFPSRGWRTSLPIMNLESLGHPFRSERFARSTVIIKFEPFCSPSSELEPLELLNGPQAPSRLATHAYYYCRFLLANAFF